MSFQSDHDLDELAAEELERVAKDRRQTGSLVCEDPVCRGARLCDACKALLARYEPSA